MKTKIKVTYPAPLDAKADKKITNLIEGIGGEWYAQGMDMEKGIRDICFDLEV